MTYRVRHVTTYDYEDPVSVSHHIVRLTPHNSQRQTCNYATVTITPQPSSRSRHIDYFGNTITLFTLLEPHDRLVIEADSEIDVSALNPPDPARSAPLGECPRSASRRPHRGRAERLPVCLRFTARRRPPGADGLCP